MAKSKTKADPMEQAMKDALASVERIEREGKGGDKEEQPEVLVDVEETADDAEDAEDAEDAAAEPAEPEEADDTEAREKDPAALNEQLLRLAADFENFRKRSRREQEELRKYGVEHVVRALLPILDNLERALQHAGAEDPILEGVQMVAKQFVDVMATYGVRGFDSLGEQFDPEKHEAMGHLPAGDAETGTVLEQLEKGYTLHDRLLRPAKVMIAAAAQGEE